MTSSWSIPSKGAFQNPLMPLCSEDSEVALGGGEDSSAKLKDFRSNEPTITNKNYTPKELQDKMRSLMTFHPQLWKEYKNELTKQPAPTSPETIRRVLIDFLNQHEDHLLPENHLNCPTLPIGSRNSKVTSVQTTWKPGSTLTARRRPRKSQSLVNSLRDSLHRSLHDEKLPSTPQSPVKSILPPLVSSSPRMPPRRGSRPLRQGNSSKTSRGAVESGSEHSMSSTSFHEDDNVLSPLHSCMKSSKFVDQDSSENPPLPVSDTLILQMDQTQRKLMRLQQIPHLWMKYQSECLYRQTMNMTTADDNDGDDQGSWNGTKTNKDQVDIPATEPHSVNAFWTKHEAEIFEYEVEQEQDRIAILQEEKRRIMASRVHIELNVSFHEEACARQPPRHYFTISDHEESQHRMDHHIMESSNHNLYQDPVQNKLSRVRQVPSLWGKFQSQLEEEEDPTDVEAIKRVINSFWLQHAVEVQKNEQRATSLLNTSFHDESVPVNYHCPMRGNSNSGNAATVFVASRPHTFSGQSFQNIQMELKDLTEEGCTVAGKGCGDIPTDQKMADTGTDRRATEMDLYKKWGEGFSSRSMRNVQIVIDGLAGEVDGDATIMSHRIEEDCTIHARSDGTQEEHSNGMNSLFLPKQKHDTTRNNNENHTICKSSTPLGSSTSRGGWFDQLSQLSAFLTQDLESEISHGHRQMPETVSSSRLPHLLPGSTHSTYCFTGNSKDNNNNKNDDDDDLFVRAAQIATARRQAQTNHQE
jgi:hypothetical protein